MKRAIKDSVFTFLFSQPEYMLELYRTLHPEDTEITASELKLVTIENILSNGLYNDLGIQAGNKLILLAEAQSTFSVNITLRMLMYLAATYKDYVETEKLDLYSSTTVRIPKPELYVIYTGNRKNVPETLRLSELYKDEGSVDLSVKVLRRSGTKDIIDQYARFCEIANEQRKEHGYTITAVEGTIHQCIAEGVLVPFLESRRKEITSIMVTLFDQEKVWEIHDYNLAKRVREESEARGVVKGKAEGKAEMATEIVRNMLKADMPFEQISALTGLSLDEVKALDA